MSELILISRITKVKNIRKEYGDIPGLAENIYNVGLINPLIVTKNKPQPGTPAMPDTYTLHAGDRRFKAMQHICKKYGLNQMEYLARAEIMELDEQLAELIQLSENIERKDLTPFEEQEYFNRAIKVKTVEDIALIIGKDPIYVRNRLQLKNLIKEFTELLKSGELPVEHAIVLSKYSAKIQSTLYSQIRMFEGDKKTGLQALATVPALKKYIKEEFELPLNSAPWDLQSANVVTGLNIPPCVLCEFNTGYNQSLFGDIEAESFCTHKKCYDQKLECYFKKRIEDLKTAKIEFVLVCAGSINYTDPANFAGRKIEELSNYKIVSKETTESKRGLLIRINYDPTKKLKVGDELILIKGKSETLLRSRPNVPRKKESEEETPIQTRERRMENRFIKEDNLDKLSVKKIIVNQLLKENKIIPEIVESLLEPLFDSELGMNGNRVLMNHGVNISADEIYDRPMTFNLGYRTINKLSKELNSFSALGLFLFQLEIARQFNPIEDDVDLKSKTDELIVWAEKYGIDPLKLYEPLQEKRKAERSEELDKLKLAKQKASVKEEVNKQIAADKKKKKSKPAKKINSKEEKENKINVQQRS